MGEIQGLKSGSAVGRLMKCRFYSDYSSFIPYIMPVYPGALRLARYPPLDVRFGRESNIRVLARVSTN